MNRTSITLTEPELLELQCRARSRVGRAGDAKIARVILLLAEGKTYVDIQRKVGCSPSFVSRWKKRFLAERLSGLRSRHRGRRPTVLTPKMEAKILARTREPPADATTHWSTRRLAARGKSPQPRVARASRRERWLEAPGFEVALRLFHAFRLALVA